MNTVLTFYDRPDEWYDNTYICCECRAEFMLDHKGQPRFCPCCGVKYDVLHIKYDVEHGGRMETIFLNEEEDEPTYCETDTEEEENEGN